MATASDMERKQEAITSSTITESVIKAIEQAGGGSVENIQTLKIGAAGEVVVDDAGRVSVGNDDDPDDSA
jgi:hypothetical protein